MSDKFIRIGKGFNTTTKKGNEAINLRIDDNAHKGITPEDLAKGVYLFPSKDGNYAIFAPMREEYEAAYQFPDAKEEPKKESEDIPF